MTYEVVSIGLSLCLITLFSYVLFYSVKNTCGFCLKSICAGFLLSNVTNIIATQDLVYITENARAIWRALGEMFSNMSYSYMALRYLFVVRGNSYVLKGLPVPMSVRKSNGLIFLINFAVNVATPIVFIMSASDFNYTSMT